MRELGLRPRTVNAGVTIDWKERKTNLDERVDHQCSEEQPKGRARLQLGLERRGWPVLACAIR